MKFKYLQPHSHVTHSRQSIRSQTMILHIDRDHPPRFSHQFHERPLMSPPWDHNLLQLNMIFQALLVRVLGFQREEPDHSADNHYYPYTLTNAEKPSRLIIITQLLTIRVLTWNPFLIYMAGNLTAKKQLP